MENDVIRHTPVPRREIQLIELVREIESGASIWRVWTKSTLYRLDYTPGRWSRGQGWADRPVWIEGSWKVTVEIE